MTNTSHVIRPHHSFTPCQSVTQRRRLGQTLKNRETKSVSICDFPMPQIVGFPCPPWPLDLAFSSSDSDSMMESRGWRIRPMIFFFARVGREIPGLPISPCGPKEGLPGLLSCWTRASLGSHLSGGPCDAGEEGSNSGDVWGEGPRPSS